MSWWHVGPMHRRGQIWLIGLAAALGLLSLANAIHLNGRASVGPWLVTLAMGFVILGQVLALRKQGKPPSR